MGGVEIQTPAHGIHDLSVNHCVPGNFSMWPKKSIWKEEAAPRLLRVQNLLRSKDAPILCLT